jgi:hypothetical protein
MQLQSKQITVLKTTRFYFETLVALILFIQCNGIMPVGKECSELHESNTLNVDCYRK